ncbi:MAG: hypothetical protein AAGF47_00915 [Planctomycetota bacterium]
MIEVVLATATVGVLSVAALSVAAGAARERSSAVSSLVAESLVHDMVEEIANKPVGEAPSAPALPIGGLFGGLLGTSTSGTQTGTTADGLTAGRLAFSTVRGYDGWTATPPVENDGTPIAGAEGLTRAVRVTEVSITDPGGPEASGSGLLRVEVTVSRGARTIARGTILRSDVFDELNQ